MAPQTPLSPSVARAQERVRRVLIGILCALPELAFFIVLGDIVGGFIQAATIFFVGIQVLVFLIVLFVAVVRYIFSGEGVDAARVTENNS